jgi:inorganic pyrophosphatase
MLENIYKKVGEPKIMLELRSGGLSEACKEIDKAHNRYCNN